MVIQILVKQLRLDVTPELVGCDPIGRSHEFIVCADKIDNFVVTPDTHVDRVRLCCTPLVCIRATDRPVARPLLEDR